MLNLINLDPDKRIKLETIMKKLKSEKSKINKNRTS
jgi:hypothetical protein